VRAVVVVGAGVAALRCVEALRAEGYDGRLTLIGDEPEPPYDRTALSKSVLCGDRAVESVVYRSRAQLGDLGVELLLGSAATGIDLRSREVVLGARRLRFDGLVIATGASARRPSWAQPRPGLHLLRTLGDAGRLRAALGGRPEVVVIGAGLIGSEVASSARALGLEVTVVESAPVPFVQAVGARMGQLCRRLHDDNGTRVLCGAGVVSIEGSGRVERVRLADGTAVAADVVVVGVGASPNTAWLAGSGVTLRDGVVCDAALRAGAPGVFAAGDVARWENRLLGASMRCEHWTNAAEQGRHVARELLAGLAGVRPFLGSAYFWSEQYGVRIQFAGSAQADEVSIVDGDPAERRFVALYRRGGRVTGAFAMDAARPFMHAKRLVEQAAPWESARLPAGEATTATLGPPRSAPPVPDRSAASRS
jgi:NADPH-dependent 2,4-dienoyl-CoA reductase/sulfur reductase-like enzyme